MKRDNLEHRFVDFIPERLEEGILYVSIEYTTVAHLCCCGCGKEVSITLSPTDWRLIFNGKTVSLEPSIGSWSLPCQSHYFITRNRIVWARQWSRAEIDAGRRYNAAGKQPQRANDSPAETPVQAKLDSPVIDKTEKRGIWGLLRSWWT
ncbi:DUF6527 family protein [Bremerella sp.]|uniref:DUF6527 family protein n=1 Tax=Bremerella sp. TaxID=2795602 RepID=UPI00391A3596